MYLPTRDTLFKKISKWLFWWFLCNLFSDFLYKSICCGYSFELHRQVDAVQMDTHNICPYKVNKKYTGCNLEITDLLDCALIGVCAVIKANTVIKDTCTIYVAKRVNEIALPMRVRLVIRRSRVRSPLGLATSFRGDWSRNIFYNHSTPSADSRKAVVSFSRKNVHKYWLIA